MAIQHLRNILLTAAFLVGVVSCGGGGSQIAGGGIGGTGISQGPITQFGSIFVNQKARPGGGNFHDVAVGIPDLHRQVQLPQLRFDLLPVSRSAWSSP